MRCKSKQAPEHHPALADPQYTPRATTQLLKHQKANYYMLHLPLTPSTSLTSPLKSPPPFFPTTTSISLSSHAIAPLYPACFFAKTQRNATSVNLFLFVSAPSLQRRRKEKTYHATSPFLTLHTYPGYRAILERLVRRTWVTLMRVLMVSA